MTIELSYDKQHQILNADVHGHLKFEDLEHIMSKILTSAEIPSDANTLWDITDMQFDNIDIEFQEKIVEMRSRFDSQRGKAKIAIVSTYPLGEILVKLFLVLMKDISQDVSSFKSREDALLWFEQTSTMQ